MLRDEPPPMTFSIRNWFADEGGQIAQSLEQALTAKWCALFRR